jgi:hypothetical protein
MPRERELLDSFQTKYGYSVSLYRSGRDVTLAAHNGTRYFEVLLGPGDAHRLVSSLSSVSTSASNRGRTRKNLTVIQGGSSERWTEGVSDTVRAEDVDDPGTQ